MIKEKIITSEDALSHFLWKLKNVWEATETDVKAINLLIDNHERNKKEKVIKQRLFAKLYVFLLGEFLKKYNATIFDPIPQRELHKILDTDLNYLIAGFTEVLNDNEIYMFFKDAGIDHFGEKHPITVSVKKSKEDNEKLIQQMKEEGKERFFGNVWKKEDVEDNLFSMINKAVEVFH